MRRVTRALPPLLAVAAFACANASPDGAGAEAELEATIRSHYEAFNRGDAETARAQHTADVTGFVSDWGPLVAFHAEEAAPLAARLEGARPDWRPRDIRIRLLNDVAVATLYIDGSIRWRDGSFDAGPRRVTEVWVRTADGWKEAHHHDDPVGPADVREQVERASDGNWAALLAGDVERVASYWTDDAIVLPPDQPRVAGLAGIRRFLRAQFDAIRFEGFQMLEREIEVMGGRALELARYELSIVPVGGGAAERVEGRYILVWQRQPDGSWKATRDIWNFAPPSGQ